MVLKVTFAIFSIFILSCISSQNKSQNLETNSAAEIEAKKIAAEKMMDDGYLPGRIIYSDIVGDCEYTIQLKQGEREFYYVDPINLEETFRRDNQTVWVKFNGLRRMNRCENAAPVELTEIKNRDE
ncbi:hypothetical protein [Aequorivita lipolytica]|uniref:Uncharacterized protein n=1 Tax=Aequorivita lipolytica TaxID=153267 RepID=A0A5C6YNZ3_9FLAO|nr:hypothetical protein [Aequorivita lipolytica]TXD69340.1 hypothetical protein ESV24_08250 [Aequorivita lipolytica]SRX50035.1 hypothetical protein AEQU2_00501 [Aequorivita lipolytica]